MNKIKHWIKADEAVEEGLYLVCFGDVETLHSVSPVEVYTNEDDELFVLSKMTKSSHPVDRYATLYKFAKLEF